jgi:Peptidase family S41
MSRRIAGLLTLLLVLFGVRASAQTLTSFDRGRALDMLAVVHEDITKHYFDSTYGGADLTAIFETARTRIKNATRVEESLFAIAQATIEVNDGHTLFLPPGLTQRADYGWSMAFVGDTCRVFSVKPQSDAAHQGVTPGDIIYRIEGIAPSRHSLFYIRYMISALFPRQNLRVLLSHAGQPPREMNLGAEVREHRRVYDLTAGHDDVWELIRESQSADDSLRSGFSEFGNDLLVWRYRGFGEPNDVDDGLKRARGHAALVLDLRGNPGGYATTLLRFLSGIYREPTTIATLRNRKETQPLFVKGSHDKAYDGKVIVLVDSRSASASEAFARSIQLAHRGTVLGDRTMGALRTARSYVHQSGTQTVVVYGTLVAVDDFIFPEGPQVEGLGVQPDELILPSGDDLRENRDPVLARALALGGVTRTAEQAARLVWDH